MSKFTKLTAALALVLGCSLASAAVEVRFVEPDKYSDVSDFAGVRDRDLVLKDIQAHFRELGDKQLPGKDLLIEVTDIDLAGQVEPFGRRMDMLRVLRSSGRPAIELRYVLSEGGKELRQGKARLSDLGYLDRMNRYSSGDLIRYEKRMMDDWFRQEFGSEERRLGRAGN